MLFGLLPEQGKIQYNSLHTVGVLNVCVSRLFGGLKVWVARTGEKYITYI